MENLTLRELLERARTVLVDTKDEHLAAAGRPKQASLHQTFAKRVKVVSTVSDVEAQIIWSGIACSAVVLEIGEKNQTCAVISATKQGT